MNQHENQNIIFFNFLDKLSEISLWFSPKIHVSPSIGDIKRNSWLFDWIILVFSQKTPSSYVLHSQVSYYFVWETMVLFAKPQPYFYEQNTKLKKANTGQDGGTGIYFTLLSSYEVGAIIIPIL